jgi:hypothetical protein
MTFWQFKELMWFIFCRFIKCPACKTRNISPRSPLGKCEPCSAEEVKTWCIHFVERDRCIDCKNMLN